MHSPLRHINERRDSFHFLKDVYPEGEIIHSVFAYDCGIEIELGRLGNPVFCYIGDKEAHNFWLQLKKDPSGLSDTIWDFYNKISEEQEMLYFLKDYNRPVTNPQLKAAIFFILNHCTMKGDYTSGTFGVDTDLNEFSIFKLKNTDLRRLEFIHMEGIHPLRILKNLQPEYHALCSAPDYSLNLLGSTRAQADAANMKIDHRELYNILSKRTNWVLLYKNHPKIRKMYKDFTLAKFDKFWNLTLDTEKCAEVIIASIT